MNTMLRVEQAANQFLDWVKFHRKPKTHKWYTEHLANFLPFVAGLTVEELRAYHLQDFVSVQPWSDSYKAGSVATIKRWANWMTEREILTSSPFQGVKKPAIQARDNVPTASDIAEILQNSHGPTKQILTVLIESGARPKELRDSRISWFDSHKLIVPTQFAKKGKPRTIYLNERSASLIAELCREREPAAHIFLNHRGQPWTQNGLLQALRRCCNGRFSPYDLRHHFATDALEQGIDSLLVGHLMGHADVSMVARVYAKPREKKLREVLEALQRSPADNSGG